jgi:acetyltransferase-like isoleucine patch superfamily enzyme
MKILSPIILFVYNRPKHTFSTLSALRNNYLADQSILYIYSDGAKENAQEEDLRKVAEVRRIAKSEAWCKEVILIERDKNLGLAENILDGVTEVVNNYGKVIVLEDDILTSKGFLKFMNEALDTYEDEKQVMHISGYIYPHTYKAKTETVFLKILSCWGWATWKRAWDKYNHDIENHIKYFQTNKNRIEKFNIEGHADYYNQLELNYRKEIYSWAVRWYASWLRSGGYSLFPTYSLTQNIGHDGSGANCDKTNIFHTEIVDSINVRQQKIAEDKGMRKSIDAFYAGIYSRPNTIQRITKRFQIEIGNKGPLKGSLSLAKLLFLKIAYYLSPSLHPILKGGVYLSEISDEKNNSSIEAPCKIYSPSHIFDSQIGKYTYISRNSYISNVEIGRFCSIGPNFLAGWGLHPTDGISTSPMFYSKSRQNGFSLSKDNKFQEREKILIGHDVHIGANVIVLDGVSIGDGAIIGAGAVVSKDIPPYAIAVGCPIRIIRFRFSQSQISDLQKIKWWNWEEEDLQEVEKHFFDIDGFIDKFSK